MRRAIRRGCGHSAAAALGLGFDFGQRRLQREFQLPLQCELLGDGLGGGVDCAGNSPSTRSSPGRLVRASNSPRPSRARALPMIAALRRAETITAAATAAMARQRNNARAATMAHPSIRYTVADRG